MFIRRKAYKERMLYMNKQNVSTKTVVNHIRKAVDMRKNGSTKIIDRQHVGQLNPENLYNKDVVQAVTKNFLRR